MNASPPFTKSSLPQPAMMINADCCFDRCGKFLIAALTDKKRFSFAHRILHVAVKPIFPVSVIPVLVGLE